MPVNSPVQFAASNYSYLPPLIGACRFCFVKSYAYSLLASRIPSRRQHFLYGCGMVGIDIHIGLVGKQVNRLVRIQKIAHGQFDPLAGVIGIEFGSLQLAFVKVLVASS